MATVPPTGQIGCLCGGVTLPLSMLASQTVPLTGTITCHCNPCRHSTGNLLPVFAWLGAAPSADVVGKLKAYAFTDRCTRHHCTTCGCVILVELPKVGRWAVPVGCVDVETDRSDGGGMESALGLVNIKSHGYVSDTVDGGLVPLLLDLGLDGHKTKGPEKDHDSKVPLFGVGHSGETNAINLEAIARMAKEASAMSLPCIDEMLEIRCHCGGVRLAVPRAGSADAESKKLTQKPKSTKYEARLCSCRSCSLSTGSLLQGWVSVPYDAVVDNLTGSALLSRSSEGDGNMAVVQHSGSNLRVYRSSKHTRRGFCDKCGATILLYSENEGKPDMVAVCAAVLRAGSGSLAREWVEWTASQIDL